MLAPSVSSQGANLIELAVSLGLEIWLIALLFKRGVRRHFPVFVVYNLCVLVAAVARLLSARQYRMYFYLFWMSEAVLIPLGLAALHEVFVWVYQGFYSLPWFKLLYRGGIAIVLLVTVRNALLYPPVEAHPAIGFILDVGNAANLLRVGVVAAFAALIKPLNVEFRQYPFGIAAGFGVASLGTLCGYLVRSEFGTKVDVFAQNASAVAYIIGLVVWIAAFGRPEEEENDWTPPVPPEEMLATVRAYLEVLGLSRKERR